MSPGQDVIIEFAGRDHHAEILQVRAGWCLAVIDVDPDWDYGELSARLDPRATVCVPIRRVHTADLTTPRPAHTLDCQ